MNGKEMNVSEDSLFSLELVVEKVYIPHTPCKFPAIAFRLLDFPTILIKHVEDDLGTAIRNKISFDPYYRMPDQFAELKDKHGNFMVKKGKSCLFKMSADVLKHHLESTPLYVMVIDMFPEVPKLSGNSTVPLNTLMDSICADLKKLGSTVPSVHGDKGLFKLYNLMGKEIGYFVLGFRLLCLGPSLIPHLPESALMQRQAKKGNGKPQPEKAFDDMLNNSLKHPPHEETEEPVVELRNSACMTEPEKHEVLLQTIDVEDKAIHVAVSSTNHGMDTNLKKTEDKESYSMATQTDQIKRVKEAMNSQKKWLDLEQPEDDDSMDVVMSNIVCPPPLFYNSEAAPKVEVHRRPSFSEEDQSYSDNLSDIQSYDGEGLQDHQIVPIASNIEENNQAFHPSKVTQQEKVMAQARKGEYIQGLPVAPRSDMVFPLLTALINELSCVQDPHFLLDISRKINISQTKKAEFKKDEPVINNQPISPSIVSAVAAALVKKSEAPKVDTAQVNKIKSETSVISKQQLPQPKVTAKAKASDKESRPVTGNNKLSYNLTRTQRLRLQKTNPKWLEKTDREKAKEKTVIQHVPDRIDMDATNFSDTLTEVRRLAEMELNSTVGGDTLHHIASEADGFDSTVDTLPHRTRKSQHPRKSQRSPLRRKTPSPKSKTKLRHRALDPRRYSHRESSDSDELHKRKKPVPLERNISGITSPAPPDSEHGYEEPLSARSDLPSSRSRSIEVHLPSADPHNESGSAATSDEEVDIPLPDDSQAEKPQVQVLNFPRYISREDSLPETIAGAPNASLNASGTLNDDSPLESTRHSHNILPSDQSGSRRNESRNMLQQSTTDLDTKQFHSTDEPELQDLVSEGDNQSRHSTGGLGRKSITATETATTVSKFPVINPQLSENSPVPSVRHSTSKLDPTIGQSYLPSMSMSKGYTSPVSSRPGTPKSSRPGTPKGATKPASGSRFDNQPLPGKGGTVTTPRNKLTPRSQSGSPKRPTPRPRRPLRESIHTDSLSSYLPSDPDNVLVSLSSSNRSGLSGGNYSDDFNSPDSVGSSVEFPKIVSSAKLGYTIS